MNPTVDFLASHFSGSSAPAFLASLANDRSKTRSLPPRSITTRNIDVATKFVGRWDQPERALYFCVSTVRPGATRRSKDTLAEIVCLHADLDFKGIAASRKQIEAALARLPLRPSLVNFSGHGLHAFWRFSKALPATPENIARVEASLKKLADVVAGDTAVCHAAALMRLPGSHNSKGGEWIEVETIASQPGGYSIVRLERWLASAKPVLHRLASAERHTTKAPDRDMATDNPWLALCEAQSFKAPVDVEERLAVMTYRGPGDDGIHATQLSTSAALLNRGWPIDTVVSRLMTATVVAAGREGRGWDWHAEERELRRMCATWMRKHPRIFFVED